MNGYEMLVISTLAGIGTFVVVVVLYMAYAWVVLWLRERKAKQAVSLLPGGQAIWTKEEATGLIALRGCFNELEERRITGAEYDSTC